MTAMKQLFTVLLWSCCLVSAAYAEEVQENRETFAAYSNRKGLSLTAIEQKYKATGIINCMGMTGTAQLTGKNNVITTAGHMFFHDDGTAVDPKKCFFYLKDDARKSQWHALDASSLKTGGNLYRDGGPNWALDWATVKLQVPMEGVAPYDYPKTDSKIMDNTPTTMVAAWSINFTVDGKYPRYIEDCTILYVSINPFSPEKRFAMTDCVSGGGSSGSAHFIAEKDGKQIIAAIHVRGGGEKNLSNINSIAIPLDGNFLAALHKNLI